MLEIRDMTIKYGGRTALKCLNYHLHEGGWLMVLGPNGAGKSSLIHGISQRASYTGTVLWKGRDLKTMKPKERAQRIGVLMQGENVRFDFTVEEVVRLGRYSYARRFLDEEDQDEGILESVLEQMQLSDFRHRSILQLSGGEMQRVFLAQVLVQDPKLLILDEPTNHLDPVYQKTIFELLQRWVKHPGRAILTVVHDLSLARAFGTDAILLKDGCTIASGPVSEMMKKAPLEETYSMDLQSWMDRIYGVWRRY